MSMLSINRHSVSNKGKAVFIMTAILGFCLSQTSQSVARSSTENDNAALVTYGVSLPRTDGYGLAPKPPKLTEADSKTWFTEGQKSCTGSCVTPFSIVLGAANGVEGRSNYISTCIRPEYSFLDLQTGEVSVHQKNPQIETLRYIGVTYQCVEYARKWWMKNRDITFGDVDAAYDILYLTEASNIRSQQPVLLARSINGAARRPPQKGDLIIYYPDRSNPDWRYGHVAVVVAVDLEKGHIALAEQNYDNKPWQDPQQFARQIQLIEVGGRYTLLDVSINERRNPDGGQIAGWIYPDE